MKRFLLLAAFIASPALCQTEIPSPVKPAPASTLTTGTQLVIVDVTVTDKSGKPIHGLKQTDFKLAEDHAPQAAKAFEEHTAIDRATAPPLKMPKLPPGTFTDFQPVPEDAPLNILLLDALNTPMADQAYVRYQLQQYVKHAEPGTRIAIFGLTRHLILLQGFSSDPEVLRNVVEHKLLPRASTLLDDRVGSGVMTDSLSDQMSAMGASASAVAGMQQFDAESASFQTQLRTQYTLEAFAALARYLQAFPGRKNLLWFSGAFPLTIFPDASLADPFSVASDSSHALRETSTALDRARVAVYPIDARGLQSDPTFGAANGKHYTRPSAIAADSAAFSQQNIQEHMAMEQIAEDTGGHAFYNNNDLASAVHKAIDSGSNFYTVAYAPTNRKQDGGYRNIRVEFAGDAAKNGYHLSYRHGYYAAEAPTPAKKTSAVAAKATDTPIPDATPAGLPAPIRSDSFNRTAMDRGAPTPSEILFKVRVLPATAAPEDALAPNNEPDPEGHFKPPFRRFVVDYAALAGNISLHLDSNNIRHGHVEFLTFVYDRDGRLLNTAGSTVSLAIEPKTFAALARAGLDYRLQISTPARGESFLRIAVHDLDSGRFGVVEISTETVSHLPPLVDPKPPAPATPAPATPTSANPAPQPSPVTPQP